METKQLNGWLEENKDKLKQELLEGTSEPQAVKRVDIPKLQEGTRQLGIPCVVDRLA